MKVALRAAIDRVLDSDQDHPHVAKAGGLQSQGAKGAVVVGYRKPLATPDLESSGFPVG